MGMSGSMALAPDDPWSIGWPRESLFDEREAGVVDVSKICGALTGVGSSGKTARRHHEP
jgi:hypothetical protein